MKQSYANFHSVLPTLTFQFIRKKLLAFLKVWKFFSYSGLLLPRYYSSFPPFHTRKVSIFVKNSWQHCNSVSHFVTWCICYLGNQNWLNATGLIIHLRLWLIMLVSLSALLLNTRSNYLVASTWKNHKKCGGGHLRYHWWYQLYVKTFM